MLTKNTSVTFGGSIRAQHQELELDAGAFFQTDDHVSSTAPSTSTLSQWNELSYLLYPWLAVGARVEYLRVAQDGANAVSDLKIVPGVVALVRPNLKLTLTASLEQATGMPAAGWGAAGLDAAPADITTNVNLEIESVQLQLWAAF